MCKNKIREDERRIKEQSGRNLRKYREKSGMSQEKLAAEIGLSFQQIQKYEQYKNRISLPRAVTLCKVLGINVVDLLNTM